MSLSARVTALATATANYLRDTVLPRVQPSGGATGQVLTKTSAANYASAWQTPASVVAGAPVSGTKTLNYTDGVLTSVSGPASATKTLTYTNGVLTQVRAVNSGVTTTKTLAYTNGSLTSVATVIT